MKIIARTLLFLLPLVLTSCYYDKYQEVYGPSLNVLPKQDTSGVYSTNVQKIFSDYCLGCHNDNLASGGYTLSSWQGAHDMAMSGRVEGALKHLPGYTAMPQDGTVLDSLKIEAILNWVHRGAPNN